MAERFKFKIGGMTCAACTSTVESAIAATLKKNCPEHKVNIHLPTHTAVIEIKAANVDRDTLVQGIISDVEEVGFTCKEIKDTTTEDNGEDKIKIRNHLINGVIGLVVGAVLLGLTLSGVGIPFAAMAALVGASSLFTIYLGWDSYRDAAVKLVKGSGTLTMDTLFSISTLTVIGASIASLFVPWLPMMMEAGILIFAFRLIGKYIEGTLKTRVGSGLTFRDRGAKKVLRQVGEDQWEAIASDDIQVGDVIRVTKGETIPVDGTLLADTSIIKTIITGHSLPVAIKKDIPKEAEIYAGMVVPEFVDHITIQVTRHILASHLAVSDLTLEDSQFEKAPIETFANQILQYFIPAVLVFAAVAGIVVGVVFNLALAIQCIAAILVSACPCTFGIITPFAVQIGMTKANEHGVQFTNARELEVADTIDTVVLDLTGTLTQGEPSVKEVMPHPTSDISLDDFYNYLHAIESKAIHPIAKAIAEDAQKKIKLKKEWVVDQVDTTTNHSGIAARINGEAFHIGNQSYLLELGISELPKVTISPGMQVAYLVRGRKVVGHVVTHDPLRKDAMFLIDELRRSGKEIHICTGTDHETALSYAAMLKIPEKHVYAGCVGASEDAGARSKVSYITSLQKNHHKKVAMIGDAGNDAVALSVSDFGIAVKSAASDVITQDKASAVIHKSSLVPVVTTFAIARQTMRNIKFNLGFSIAYNITTLLVTSALLIAIGFALNPAIGAALMVVQAAIILWNLYRIKHQQLDHIKRLDAELTALNKEEEKGDGSYRLYKQNGLCQVKGEQPHSDTEYPSASDPSGDVNPLNGAAQVISFSDERKTYGF